jgi:peptidoglycan/LPS O-acetylase OafA/YrhL
MTSLHVVIFHLNYILLEPLHGARLPWLYKILFTWTQVGDFHVAPFFVISGYLLAGPAARSATWQLKNGVGGFLKRRATRLLIPYAGALLVALPMYVAWRAISGQPVTMHKLAIELGAHIALIHNWWPNLMLTIDGPLWYVGLEFQCYVLFATVFLWLTRRVGPINQFLIILVLSLVPHFAFHGLFDYMRLWYVALFAMGVAAIGISNPHYPRLTWIEQRVPWGPVCIVATGAAIVAIAASGKNIEYGAGWLQNLLTGAAVAAFLIFARTGFRGPLAALGASTVRFLEWKPLFRLGLFSYSTYLIHAPILSLCVWAFSRVTGNMWIQAGVAYLVFMPLAFGAAYLFHTTIERPFQHNPLANPPAVTSDPSA